MSLKDSYDLCAPIEFGGEKNYEPWRDWCMANALRRFRLKRVPANQSDVFAVGDEVVLVGYVRPQLRSGEEIFGGPMFVRPADLGGNVYRAGDVSYWSFFTTIGDRTLRGIWGDPYSSSEPRNPAAYIVRIESSGTTAAATDYPHLCPRCRGPACVGFREIDCQRKCR